MLTQEEHQKTLTVYKEYAKITEEIGLPHQVDHIHSISKGSRLL
jgi:hypothetical protein